MTTPSSESHETPRPSVAKYTEQIVFFTDRTQEAALHAAVSEVLETRAEIVRRVLDHSLPTLAHEFVQGKVRDPYDNEEPFDRQVVFNLEPSQMALIDALVQARKDSGRARENRGTVIREAINRGLKRLIDTWGRAHVTDTTRNELRDEVRHAASARPVSNGAGGA
jgi:hypothetical protein